MRIENLAQIIDGRHTELWIGTRISSLFSPAVSLFRVKELRIFPSSFGGSYVPGEIVIGMGIDDKSRSPFDLYFPKKRDRQMFTTKEEAKSFATRKTV